MTTDWIMTQSGRQFFPLEPRLEDVTIADIAHALGAVNRYNGHTRVPYSVAQHSVLVSRELRPDGPAVALLGLLHDASEAYLGDVPRPLKRLPAFAEYRAAEARLEAVIYRAFGLEAVAADRYVIEMLKLVDRRMLRTEQAQLMPPPAHGEDRTDVAPFRIAITPWSPVTATTWFLREFAWLTAEIGKGGA